MTEQQQPILNLSQFHSHSFFFLKHTVHKKKRKHYVILAFFSYICAKNPQFPSNTTTDKVHNWKNTVRDTYLQHSHTAGH